MPENGRSTRKLGLFLLQSILPENYQRLRNQYAQEISAEHGHPVRPAEAQRCDIVWRQKSAIRSQDQPSLYWRRVTIRFKHWDWWQYSQNLGLNLTLSERRNHRQENWSQKKRYHGSCCHLRRFWQRTKRCGRQRTQRGQFGVDERRCRRCYWRIRQYRSSLR